MASRQAADVAGRAGTQLRKLVFLGGARAVGSGCRAGARDRHTLLRGTSAIAGVRNWERSQQGVMRGYSSCAVVGNDKVVCASSLRFSPFGGGSDLVSRGCHHHHAGAAIPTSKTFLVSTPGSNKGVKHGRRECSSDALPTYQEVAMPALSPTMSQGNLAKWRMKEGDKVNPGDVLCEIETDKATLDMESQEEGYIAKILVPDGTSSIPVGKPIAIMVEEQAHVAKFVDFMPPSAGAGAAAAQAPAAQAPPPPPPAEDVAVSVKKADPVSPPPPPPPPSQAAPAKSQVDSSDRVFISPAAKKLALDSGVDLSSLKGTGPDGRIVRTDVESFLAAKGQVKPAAAADVEKAGTAAPIEGVEYTDIPQSQIRKITASRLLMSKQTIPHYYLYVDARLDKLKEVRERLNAKQAETGGKKLSINDFVIKASALALRQVPQVNSSWQNEVIRQYHNVDVTVAVQTEAGLMVPFVKNADKKGIAAISEEVKMLADKAKKGKLAPSEFQGGTFTISNLGMYGIKQFAAIVNPPQAAILAVGAAEKRAVPKPDGEFESGTFITVTLSCDHRVVDGAVGAQWLQAFKSYIEDPMTMLL